MGRGLALGDACTAGGSHAVSCTPQPHAQLSFESSPVHRGTDDVSVAQLIEEYRLRNQTTETKVPHYDSASLSSTVIDWLTAHNLRVMITSTLVLVLQILGIVGTNVVQGELMQGHLSRRLHCQHCVAACSVHHLMFEHERTGRLTSIDHFKFFL
jgi:hypothetical protein